MEFSDFQPTNLTKVSQVIYYYTLGMLLDYLVLKLFNSGVNTIYFRFEYL